MTAIGQEARLLKQKWKIKEWIIYSDNTSYLQAFQIQTLTSFTRVHTREISAL